MFTFPFDQSQRGKHPFGRIHILNRVIRFDVSDLQCPASFTDTVQKLVKHTGPVDVRAL